ncbi:MAG: NfeD family protein [Tidjanibacter sp.]|nr:NfeD family protein [Tidjanibacter sp.]
MEIWHIWAIVATLFVIGEMLTAGFALICFAVGAVGGAIGAAAGASLEWQLGIFALATLVAFLAVRPLLRRLSAKDEVPTNADALIGRTAKVTECIEVGGRGRVAIDGDIWQAESSEQSDILEGEKVEIISRESIILTVRRK